MRWEKVRLEDLCISITDGDHQSIPLAERGIPFIVIANINSINRIEFEKARYVPIDYYEKLDEKRKPSKGDVLLTVKGSFGIPVYVDTDSPFVFQRDIAIFKCNEKVNSMFLFYYMKNREFYLYADSVAIGAAQRALTLKLLKNTIVTIPSLEKQDKIVELLAPYDKLISNNQKQIKLLEEAAQRLYKEWFVDLRFPGYENTKIVDGVPEGWKKEKLTDMADVQYGFAFDGSLFNSQGKGTPIIRIRNIPNGTTNDYTTQEVDEQYIVSNGDIVVGMDGEFHINSWSGKAAYLVQRTCKFEPKNELMRGWLLQAIYEPIKFFEKTVVGATVAHLGKKHIDTIELLTGLDELYVPFKTLFDKRQVLLNQNILLSQARDRLLSKLMSGEMEV